MAQSVATIEIYNASPEATGNEKSNNTNTPDRSVSTPTPKEIVNTKSKDSNTPARLVTTVLEFSLGMTSTETGKSSQKIPDRNSVQNTITSEKIQVLSVHGKNSTDHEYNSDELPDLVLAQTRSVATDSLIQDTAHNGINAAQTPIRTHSENNSQPSTTPRSVLSDPDDTEIKTANTLLSMGSLENIDNAVDSEILLPVDKPRTEDFTKDLAELNRDQGEHATEDSDSDKTVEYGDLETPEKPLAMDETMSPKGVVRYKHYGIKRQSPSTTKV